MTKSTATLETSLPSPDRLVTISEVVNLTKISKATIYRLVRDGKFPRPAKIGRMTRWSEQSVYATIEGWKTSAGVQVRVNGGLV